MTIVLILVVLFALLFVGVPVAFALGALGLGLLLAGGFSPLMAPQAILSTLDNSVLLAVPLFLMISNVLLKGGMGRDLFAAVQAWVGHWPGGLPVARWAFSSRHRSRSSSTPSSPRNRCPPCSSAALHRALP